MRMIRFMCVFVVWSMAIISSMKSQTPSIEEREKAVMEAMKSSLKTDENTKYFDEENNEITREKFRSIMESGSFTMSPKVKGTQVVSIQLKRVDAVLAKGTALADFTGTTLDGKTVSLASMKGKVVVLNYWFTTCAPCISEMPELNELVAKYRGNNDVIFLAPTFDKKETVTKFLAKKEFAYMAIPDMKQLMNDHAINAYPSHLVIDRAGTIGYFEQNSGKQTVAQLDKQIQRLLANNEPLDAIATAHKEKVLQQRAERAKTARATGGDEESMNDVALEGMFSMSSKTKFLDHNNQPLDMQTAIERIQDDNYKPFKRVKDGVEYIVVKKAVKE